jgi:PKD repeat protein
MLGGNRENMYPIAYASANVTIGKIPLEVNFKGSGLDRNGKIVSYIWDFGDGETSNLQNPTHIYKKNGKYIATLTVIDNDGNIGKKNIIIYAQENITSTIISSDKNVHSNYVFVDFTWSPKYPDPGQQITFISNYYDYHGKFSSKFWNFGDGYNAWGSAVTHTYNKKGKYKVTLIVSSTNFSSGEVTNGQSSKYIHIGASPFPEFTYSPEVPTTREKVFFDASESWDNNGQIVKYYWSYIDSNKPNTIIKMDYNETFTYTWNKQGNYNVKLTVTDDDNNTNEITKNIIVSVLKITDVTAGFRQVGFKITNNGDFTVNNIHWKVIVNRNFLILPLWRIFLKKGFLYSLRPGESISVDISRYRRGYGRITLSILVEADNALKILNSRQGFMFGKIIHLRSG